MSSTVTSLMFIEFLTLSSSPSSTSFLGHSFNLSLVISSPFLYTEFISTDFISSKTAKSACLPTSIFPKFSNPKYSAAFFVAVIYASSGFTPKLIAFLIIESIWPSFFNSSGCLSSVENIQQSLYSGIFINFANASKFFAAVPCLIIL